MTWEMGISFRSVPTIPVDELGERPFFLSSPVTFRRADCDPIQAGWGLSDKVDNQVNSQKNL